MMRRLMVLFLMWALMLDASAQALPSRIGQQVAAVVESKVGLRGFAANDPRFGATVSSVGAAVTEIAAAVVIAGTAPAWGTVLASAAIAGAVGYGVQALANWVFHSDGTVTYTPPPPPASSPPDTTSTMVAGGAYYQAGNLYAGSGQNLAMEYAHVMWPNQTFIGNTTDASGNFWYWVDDPASSQGHCAPYSHCRSEVISKQNSGAPANCGAGMIYSGGTCGAMTSLQPSGPPPAPTTKPAGDALSGMTDAQKATPLPAKVVADIADAAWRNAAGKPGYSGVPYLMTDPVTASDVATAVAANPSIPATIVGDLAAPISSTDPLGQASTGGATQPSTNPAASNPLQNLGPDPNIGAPNLEAIPTAQQIIDPLAGLAPTLKNWVVPAHSVECSKPAFDLFNKHIVMDQQCSMFEANRSTLYNSMLVAWALIALFIVLSA